MIAASTGQRVAHRSSPSVSNARGHHRAANYARGHCGETEVAQLGDCDVGKSGSFTLHKAEVAMNWTKAEEEENEGGNEGQDGDLFDSEDSDESDDGDGAEKETGKEDQSQHLVSGPWSFVSCLLSLIALPYTI